MSLRQLLSGRTLLKYVVVAIVILAALSAAVSLWELMRWRDTQRFGVVESVTLSSMQVRDDRAGRTFLVRVSSDTAIREGAEAGIVHVGDHIMIVGESNPDGSFEAGLIRIVDFPKRP